MPNALRANWIAVSSSLLLLAAIGYVVSQQQKLGTIVQVWRQTNRWYFAVAVVLTLALIHTLGAWRLAAIMRFDNVGGVQFRSILRIQLISQFVAYGTPFSAIADLARAAMLKLRYHLTPGRSVRLVFSERISGAFGTVLVGFAGSFILLAFSVSCLQSEA
jgi:uncharacterized membrane protein YbhN (UPF0104 family)